MPISPTQWKGRPSNSVPFGLKDGRLYYVTDVPLGKQCECICPDCNEPLIAKNNPSPTRKRTFHFQHRSSNSCAGGWESAPHRMAKEIILRASSIALPGWTSGEVVAHEAAISIRNESVQEVRLLDGQIRPDVKINGDFNAIAFDDLYIEVRVRHAVDHAKAEIVRANCLSMIEIDLSSVTDEQLLDEELFTRLVLQEPANRRWIHLGNASYLSSSANCAVVEIVSAETRTRTIATKSGRPLGLIEQSGIVHKPEERFPITFQIPDRTVGVEPKPYAPGLYSISGKSLRVDQYGRLRFGFKLYLDSLEIDPPAGINPEQQLLAL